jgi:hypothetical protein
MKRVCLFGFPPIDNLEKYHIETFNPEKYFDKDSRWSVSTLIHEGINGWDKQRSLFSGAAGVDRLYRERDPCYMRMVSEFIDRFSNFDIIVMASYNFIHPELLSTVLKKPIKIIGFIDDPMSTYTRGIPYLWAFDGAFFVSPGYLDGSHFEKSLSKWGAKNSTWWPLVPYPYEMPDQQDDSFFGERDIDLIYVGGYYGPKLDRLIVLKRHFGSRLRVHGRWPFEGYSGLVRGIAGRPVYPYRVTSLTSSERKNLYWRTKIGFNMHLSNSPSECGNMRTYETPAHGMMMVSDKGAANGHAQIFAPNKEAVYYDNLNEAIELIEYYLKNNEARVTIAKAGFDRFWKDYEWKANINKFLEWCESIRK